jgi:predicted nucleic acid-binding protein
VKTCYFDASALVKLVLDEPNSDIVREFVRRNTNLCTTSLCYAEAFGVLKRKWLERRLTIGDYYGAARKLARDVVNKMRLDEVEWVVPSMQDKIEQLGTRHNLDLSDALQLATLLYGTFSYMGPNSTPVLITADKDLASAAREGNASRVELQPSYSRMDITDGARRSFGTVRRRH